VVELLRSAVAHPPWRCASLAAGLAFASNWTKRFKYFDPSNSLPLGSRGDTVPDRSCPRRGWRSRVRSGRTRPRRGGSGRRYGGWPSCRPAPSCWSPGWSPG
jgi:hypothetical protein